MKEPFELEILCGNCKKPINFISQIESGFPSCWEMADELVIEYKNSSISPVIKCNHCGELNWNFFLEQFYNIGKKNGISKAAERMKDFILKT